MSIQTNFHPNHVHQQNMALLPLAAHKVAQESPTNDDFIRNIKEGNCNKTYYIAHEKAPITTFAKFGEYLVTVAKDDKIVLWENGIFRRKIDLENQMGSKATIRLADGKIVFGSSVEIPNAEEYSNKMEIYRLDGVKISCTSNLGLIQSRICPISKSIFSVYQKDGDTIIGEWDLEGKQVASISSTLTSRKLIASDKYLVHFNEKELLIYHRHEKTSKILDLPLEFSDSKISHMHIDGSLLYCGLWNPKNHIECYIIDLEKVEMISQYRSQDHDSEEREIGKGTLNSSKVQQMAADHNHVFLGHSNHVVAVNLPNKTHISIGKHKAPITLVALKNDLLFTGSDNTEEHPAELKIWHPATMALISEMELPSLQMLDLSDKIMAAVGSVIIEWDYQVQHKGTMTHINTKPPLRNVAL